MGLGKVKFLTPEKNLHILELHFRITFYDLNARTGCVHFLSHKSGACGSVKLSVFSLCSG